MSQRYVKQLGMSLRKQVTSIYSEWLSSVLLLFVVKNEHLPIQCSYIYLPNSFLYFSLTVHLFGL